MTVQEHSDGTITMTDAEFEGLCRQLRLSYSANRRSAHAFQVCLAGAGLLPPAPPPTIATADTDHDGDSGGETSISASAEGGKTLWKAALQEQWHRWGVQ